MVVIICHTLKWLVAVTNEHHSLPLSGTRDNGQDHYLAICFHPVCIVMYYVFISEHSTADHAVLGSIHGSGWVRLYLSRANSL